MILEFYVFSLQSKIQFRLIDGSNIVQKFDSTQTLSEIRQFLVEVKDLSSAFNNVLKRVIF